MRQNPAFVIYDIGKFQRKVSEINNSHGMNSPTREALNEETIRVVTFLGTYLLIN